MNRRYTDWNGIDFHSETCSRDSYSCRRHRDITRDGTTKKNPKSNLIGWQCKLLTLLIRIFHLLYDQDHDLTNRSHDFSEWGDSSFGGWPTLCRRFHSHMASETTIRWVLSSKPNDFQVCRGALMQYRHVH